MTQKRYMLTSKKTLDIMEINSGTMKRAAVSVEPLKVYGERRCGYDGYEKKASYRNRRF